MGRAPCCNKLGLNKGPWTNSEDVLLSKYIEQHGEGNWRALPKAAGLLRCGKSCRLRWINYLRPDLKRGNISEDEEDLIIKLHSLLGNRWSLIAGRIPGRTDNEIKNYWNSHLSKKLNVRSGMNLATHNCSRNVVCSEQKQEAISAENKDIHKKKLTDFNSNQINFSSGDLESITQDTYPSFLEKNYINFDPAYNMAGKGLMQHSEQPLQNVINLSDTDQFFSSKSEIENSRRSLPTSPTTVFSCFMLDSDYDFVFRNEKSFSNSPRPLAYNDLTPLEDVEPSSGMTSPESISSYYSFDRVYDPTFELINMSKNTCVLHNQGVNESLDYDYRRDSANATPETAREDTSREASIADILPDLKFLEELEVDNLWDCLSISSITDKSSSSVQDSIPPWKPKCVTDKSSSNADSIESEDAFWADIFTDVDTSMWMYDKGCLHTHPWPMVMNDQGD